MPLPPRLSLLGSLPPALPLSGPPSPGGVVALGLRCLAPLSGSPLPPSPPSPALPLRLSLSQVGMVALGLRCPTRPTRPLSQRALYLVRYFGTFGL